MCDEYNSISDANQATLLRSATVPFKHTTAQAPLQPICVRRHMESFIKSSVLYNHFEDSRTEIMLHFKSLTKSKVLYRPGGGGGCEYSLVKILKV
jgi:hypothetical protein